MEKHKATYHEMIDDMKEKGIKFDLISEKSTIEYLRKNNYYFKLTAYRKNFEKKNGSYANLDFAYLVDLATIDAHLRYLILAPLWPLVDKSLTKSLAYSRAAGSKSFAVTVPFSSNPDSK